MKALLVIDVQKGITESRDFTAELDKIEKLILDFKKESLPVIFVRHFDMQEGSPLHRDNPGSELSEKVSSYADIIVEKHTPSAFFQTHLQSLLEEQKVDHLFIAGFETEFCCMFTTIAAYDRGYKVTFIEDATGSTNDAETYEYPFLDINDFVGTVLNWSGSIEVLYFDEFKEQYSHMLKS